MYVILKLVCLVVFIIATICEAEVDSNIVQVQVKTVKRAEATKDALIDSIEKKLQRLKNEFTKEEFDLLDDTLTDGEECPKVARELANKYKPKGKGKSREKRARSCSSTCNGRSCSVVGWGCWCRCSWGKPKCTCIKEY